MPSSSITTTPWAASSTISRGSPAGDDSPEPGNSGVTQRYSAGIAARTMSHAIRFCVVP